MSFRFLLSRESIPLGI